MDSNFQQLMEQVAALKREGNDRFNDGNRRHGTDEGNDALRRACVLYGQAIEAVMELEMEWEAAPVAEDTGTSGGNGGNGGNGSIGSTGGTAVSSAAGEDDESASSTARTEELDADLSSTKIALFLNLAQANILLGSFDGALRCCNAAVQLCNAPSLPLSELAPSEDHVELLLPAAPGSHALAAKALFRRGKCYSELSEDGRALSDYQAAHRLSPQNKQILDALLGAEDTAGRVPSEWGAKGESRSDYCPSAASAAVSAWGGQGGGGSTGAPATATTAAGSTQSGSADEADGALAVDGGDPAEGEMDSCASVSSACTATTFPAAAAAAAAAATVTATATGGMKQQQQPSVAPPPGPGVGNRERMRPADAAPFPVDLTANGGHCWLRRGHWSQTVADAAVYLPVALFIGRHAAEPVTGRQQWKVEFKRMAVIVTFQPLPSSSGGSGSDGGAGKAATLPLEHIIVSSECTWTLDHVGGPLGSTAGRQHLVLHLSKAPSVEWFPGCEWWDRVFAGDEAIDTMTCSVGADTAQLPAEARAAAERESRRFADLSESQRREELDRLTRAKQCFVEAEQRTRMAAEEEDAAVGNVPEQAEMLEKLRETFPSIDFRAK